MTRTTDPRPGRFACALGLGVLLACGTARACDDGWLDVQDRYRDDGVDVLASNGSDYPLTFTVAVRPKGLTLDGRREVTATLGPGESRTVFSLDRAHPDRGGHYRYWCDWTVGRLDARHDDSQVYLLPYATGHSYRVLQGYGSRFSHTGREQYAVDFKMAEGTPVHAARDGIVARVVEQHDKGCWEDGCGRYANFIVVLHGDGTTGEYYHLRQHGALVEEGERVRAGQRIGLSGNTGHSALPHLHFAVYRAVDWGRTQSIPVRFLTADGIVSKPRRGGRYPAAALDDLGTILGRAGGHGTGPTTGSK